MIMCKWDAEAMKPVIGYRIEVARHHAFTPHKKQDQ
jgi:hypothetical protein